MISTTDIDRQNRFLRLYELQRNALWRFVRSMVRTEHEAEDLVSETILQAYQALHRLHDDKAFVSFMFTIAHRIVRRYQWRRKLFGSYDEVAAEAIADGDMLPDELADVAVLREALQRIPARMREAVVLFDIVGLTLQEICEVQGGTLSGVKSRLKRGREALATLLRANAAAAVPEVPATPMFTHQPIL